MTIGNDMIIDVVCTVVKAKVTYIISEDRIKGWDGIIHAYGRGTYIISEDRIKGWDGIIHAYGRNFEVSIVEIEDLK